MASPSQAQGPGRLGSTVGESSYSRLNAALKKAKEKQACWTGLRQAAPYFVTIR
jgi:hypothetical protein